jgi:hypothetical protein
MANVNRNTKTKVQPYTEDIVVDKAYKYLKNVVQVPDDEDAEKYEDEAEALETMLKDCRLTPSSMDRLKHTLTIKVNGSDPKFGRIDSIITKESNKKEFETSVIVTPVALMGKKADLVTNTLCKVTFAIMKGMKDKSRPVVKNLSTPYVRITVSGGTAIKKSGGYSGKHQYSLCQMLSDYERQLERKFIDRSGGVFKFTGTFSKYLVDENGNSLIPEGKKIMPYFKYMVGSTEFQKQKYFYISGMWGNMVPAFEEEEDPNRYNIFKKKFTPKNVTYLPSPHIVGAPKYKAEDGQKLKEEKFTYCYEEVYNKITQQDSESNNGHIDLSKLVPTKWVAAGIPELYYRGIKCNFIADDIKDEDYIIIKTDIPYECTYKDDLLQDMINEQNKSGKLIGYDIEKVRTIMKEDAGSIHLDIGIKSIYLMERPVMEPVSRKSFNERTFSSDPNDYKDPLKR